MANYKDLKYIFPTSAITSGTFDDARIAASNVNQHATSFDDNQIINDLSTLGLRVHTQENLSGSNTNSSSFDVFQDATKVTSLTNCARDSGEFMSAVGSAQAEISYSGGTANTNSTAGGGYGAATAFANNNSQFATSGGTNDTDPWYLLMDFGSSKVITGYSLDVGGTFGNGSPLGWTLRGADNADLTSNPTVLDTVSNNSGGSNPYSANFLNNTNSFRYWGIKVTLSGSNQYIYVTELNLFETTTTVNATGSFQGTAITAASSTNKMGAVITYQDNAGTNTLNTDIVLQLSADNGSNFATATLTALPDFATGIKMAKVNDLSVTAGTQLKYKISFANQTNSKNARIRGVSLQY
jgi:hypothetical protein